MRFVIQRVSSASVKVGAETVGAIGKGLVVLIGVSNGDTQDTADKMTKKLINMRIFDDQDGKTNLNLDAVGGELLLISQFTLYADCRRGNRPGFTDAAGPEEANRLYQYIIDRCREALDTPEEWKVQDTPEDGLSSDAQGGAAKSRVATGIFGAHMEVSLVNQGPFTIILDSNDLN